MTSNIEAIRAAEAQIPQLRVQLAVLRAAALADDQVIDAEEQAEIEGVEALIADAQRVITERRQDWEANKKAYEQLRSGTDASLTEVASCEHETLRKDQQTISGVAAQVDQIAVSEDFATALDLASALERQVANFQSQARRLQERLEENERLEKMTPEELANTSLAAGDPEDIFDEEYMEELATAEFKGEGTEDLGNLMNEIGAGVSGPRRAELMAELEDIVGVPPAASELDGDYGRFLILRKQQNAIGTQNNQDEVPALNEKKHPEFLASRGQLQFGKVLGDAYGVHGVFASQLSPTGGLVGPDNRSVQLDPDNPVALHGVVHDVAGYMKSYHNEGPGYNYLENAIEKFASDAIQEHLPDIANDLLPYTGQVSGVAYWVMEAGDEYIEKRYDKMVVGLEKELTGARDRAAEEVGELISSYEEAKQEVSDAAEEFKDDVEDRLDEAEKELRDLAETAETEALEVVDAFEDGADRARTSAVEAYEEASAEARAMRDEAREKLDALESFIWS